MARFGNGVELAELLGVTPQAVSKAVKSGRITRAENGKFDLDAAAIQYRLHTDPHQQKRALAQNHFHAEQPAARIEQGAAPSGDDVSTIRRRRELAEARLAEITLQEREGALVKREEVERDGRRLASAIVQQLQSIPDRIAAEFGADDEQRRKIRQRLLEELDRVRAEFSRAGLMAVQ